MELGSARAGERDEVLDLLAEWYDDRNFFARYNLNDPAFRDDYCLVARDHGHIVSTVQIFDRRVTIRGAEVSLGGIGSVYTTPSYRGRGLASALIKMALALMSERGFQLSLLFADRTDYYARFGWHSVTRRFSALTQTAHLSADPASLAAFDPNTDLERVAEIYRRYSGGFNFTLHRDLSYWRGNLRFAGNPEEYFVTARDEGRIVAYARAMRWYELPMVMEYGYDDDGAAAMVSLFRHLGELSAGQPTSFGPDKLPAQATELKAAPGASGGILVTQTAHDPELESRLRGAGATIIVNPDPFCMWRVVLHEQLTAILAVDVPQVERALFAALEAPNALYWVSDRF